MEHDIENAPTLGAFARRAARNSPGSGCWVTSSLPFDVIAQMEQGLEDGVTPTVMCKWLHALGFRAATVPKIKYWIETLASRESDENA